MSRNGMTFVVFLVLSLLIIVSTRLLQGSALAAPPSVARQWAVTPGAASLSITLTLSAGSGPATGATKSVLLCHDGATGAPDVYVNFLSGTAAAPTAGGYNLTIKAGEKINYDGQYNILSYISSGAATSMRIQATY